MFSVFLHWYISPSPSIRSTVTHSLTRKSHSKLPKIEVKRSPRTFTTVRAYLCSIRRGAGYSRVTRTDFYYRSAGKSLYRAHQAWIIWLTGRRAKVAIGFKSSSVLRLFWREEAPPPPPRHGSRICINAKRRC